MRVTVKVDMSHGRPQVGVPGPVVSFPWFVQGLCAASEPGGPGGLVPHLSGAEYRPVSLGRAGKEDSFWAVEHVGVFLVVLFLL